MPTDTLSHLDILKEAIAARESQVKAYLLETQKISLGLPHLHDAVHSYLKAGGKSLRPAVLMFACGAVGGDERAALPAAAAVELYHTFTLVHDDIIDRDSLRRGVPTVHVDFAQRAERELGYPPETAAHYGLAVAILAGDIQQGWAASLFSDLYRTYGRSPELALNLVDELFRQVQCTLVNGEALDIVLAETPLEQVTDAQILDMLWQKTGILYEFAGRAGAAIGLNTPDLDHPIVQRMARFTGNCGVAFQIQDDVLGVAGKTAKTGKAVGADIREGKRTLIVMGSLPHMTPTERALTLATLGNPDATAEQIVEVAHLLDARGGIAYAQGIARRYLDAARQELDAIADSAYKQLLGYWADYIVSREV